MNKEYCFKVIKTGACINGRVVYKDMSFNFLTTHTIHVNIFSLSIGYQDLDFTDFTNRAERFEGFNDFRLWFYKPLTLPMFEKGELYIINNIKDKVFMYEEYVEDWPTYYDKEKNIICIGDYNTRENDIAVEFCTNIIVVLEDQYLKAIWIKNCEFLDVEP